MYSTLFQVTQGHLQCIVQQDMKVFKVVCQNHSRVNKTVLSIPANNKLLSVTVTTQPVLTNTTPAVTVQASENQDNVPGVLRQENGMSSARNTMQQTLDLHGYELLTTYHVTHIAAESEPTEKAVPGDEGTHDTLRKGNHDKVMLRTYQTKTGNGKSKNQSKKIDVFDLPNDAQVGAEVGVQEAHIVENVVVRQDKCGVESGILQKCLSSPSYLGSCNWGWIRCSWEEGNLSSGKVMRRLLEEREVTILGDCVCSHVHCSKLSAVCFTE